ncbi:hypothetical protein HBA54_06580 [Pelagibius litoralis]|uniref:Uncharacterized protein n=1 Tax=Pelagibius litoralis TaxID=374515 RepID=A0A967EVS0_9PROT|nr:hypothetical protein [Pelagibius litoralis]NIA68254.1 hypothetical protein [Pelagibius litoralis]
MNASILALALAAPLIVAATTAFSGSAEAQGPQCAPREALLQSLSKNYKEAPVNMGVTSTGSLIEILASPAGSWTILVTVPGGPTCMVSSGDGWRKSPIQIAQDPAV